MNFLIKKKIILNLIKNYKRLVKIVSIASQKFISEIVNDVMQHHILKSKNAVNAPTTSASQTSKQKFFI